MTSGRKPLLAASALKQLERKAFQNAKRVLPKPTKDTSKLSSRASAITKGNPKARFVSERIENDRHYVVLAKEVPKHGVILLEYGFVAEQAIAAMKKQFPAMGQPARRFPRLKKIKKGK